MLRFCTECKKTYAVGIDCIHSYSSRTERTDITIDTFEQPFVSVSPWFSTTIIPEIEDTK